MSEANETPPPKFKWKNAKEIGQEVEEGGEKKVKRSKQGEWHGHMVEQWPGMR